MAQEERVQALTLPGLSTRQANFLVLVMLHAVFARPGSVERAECAGMPPVIGGPLFRSS